MGAVAFQLLCKAKGGGLAAEQRPLESVQREAQVCMPELILAVVSSTMASCVSQSYLVDSAPSAGDQVDAVRPQLCPHPALWVTTIMQGSWGEHTAWQAV